MIINIEPNIRINDEQIAFFYQHGYLAIEAITTQEEVERLREAYDRLITWKVGGTENKKLVLAEVDENLKQSGHLVIANPHAFYFALRNTLYEANASAISRRLLGEDAELRESYVIYKPARYGTPTPWHQDGAYLPPNFEFNFLTFWMPLQGVTPENGCMRFIPGSHRFKVMPHHHVNDDPHNPELEIDDGYTDLSKSVACPLPPGGATIHTLRTVHGTGANRSNLPRRALILDFANPCIRPITPQNW
jgi:ectoine hydroxylase-related dioxygenase (phytanoyl-CoA dioxygenase family)